MKVSIDSMAQAITKELDKYQQVTTEQVKETVKMVADDTKETLKQTAPKRTGKYAKSWVVTVNYDNPRALSVVVHSKNRYQLTHLLEFGHVKRNGGRTKAYPHIAAAEAKAMQLFEEKIKEIVK